MAGVVQTGNYPNPSSMGEWTDHEGRTWHRQGERGRPLDEKRARRLLRDRGVPLATWSAGDVTWFDDRAAKTSAAIALYARAVRADDVFPSEWTSRGGDHLLMLEHLC